MNRELTVGDRVRVVTRNWIPDCYSGDKGTVRSGPHSSPGGAIYYLLAMDRNTNGAFLFTAKEIEPDRADESPQGPPRDRSSEGKTWTSRREKP